MIVGWSCWQGGVLQEDFRAPLSVTANERDRKVKISCWIGRFRWSVAYLVFCSFGSCCCCRLWQTSAQAKQEVLRRALGLSETVLVSFLLTIVPLAVTRAKLSWPT